MPEGFHLYLLFSLVHLCNRCMQLQGLGAVQQLLLLDLVIVVAWVLLALSLS